MSDLPEACAAGSQTAELAWLDGSFIPRHSLCLPVGDAGFVMGATVTEQLRTFSGRLFLPVQHEERPLNWRTLHGWINGLHSAREALRPASTHAEQH